MATNTTERVPGDVLLVGSLPFDDVEQARRASAEGLRGHVCMLPDGEVGPRQMWVGFVRETVFSGHPQLVEQNRPVSGTVEQPDREQAQEDRVRGSEYEWTFTVKLGEDLRFDDLRYGQAAIDSYRTFERLRDEGVIEPYVCFHVGMPSPDSSVDSFFQDPADWPKVKRAYVDALGREVEKMLTVIPAHSLAIQYELVWEVVDVSMGTENFIPFWPRQTVEEKFAHHTELSDLAGTMPEGVLLGYHWCYGTWGG